MTSIALVDFNNFYVSYERAFNPAHENNPVIVLSDNDGNATLHDGPPFAHNGRKH